MPGRNSCASTSNTTTTPMPTAAMRCARPTAKASQGDSLGVPPGRVAQLVRAPRLHRGGRPFESGRAHRSPFAPRELPANPKGILLSPSFK